VHAHVNPPLPTYSQYNSVLLGSRLFVGFDNDYGDSLSRIATDQGEGGLIWRGGEGTHSIHELKSIHKVCKIHHPCTCVYMDGIYGFRIWSKRKNLR
jgi:hypothetical protein